MPTCEQCHSEIPEGSQTCLVCEEAVIPQADEAREAFLAYDGDEYFIRAFMEDGQPEEQARQEVQDPRFIRLYLEFGGLEYLLKDRWATKGLLSALLDRDPGVLESLNAYVSERIRQQVPEQEALGIRIPARAKTGPKPDPATGKYKQERAAELREEGLTLGQIALRIYGDPKHANKVAALLIAARKPKGRQQ